MFCYSTYACYWYTDTTFFFHLILILIKQLQDPHREATNLWNWPEKKEVLKKNFRASTGFEPVTSVNTGAMLYQLSYEATHWEPGHFCGFYLSHEGNRWKNKWKLFCTAERSKQSHMAASKHTRQMNATLLKKPCSVRNFRASRKHESNSSSAMSINQPRVFFFLISTRLSFEWQMFLP